MPPEVSVIDPFAEIQPVLAGRGRIIIDLMEGDPVAWSILGGVVVDSGLGLKMVPIAAALVALCGVGAAMIAIRQDRRAAH